MTDHYLRSDIYTPPMIRMVPATAYIVNGSGKKIVEAMTALWRVRYEPA